MSRPTKYSVITQGWGGRPNFQHSHGLKMIPDDIEEGNIILDEILEGAVEEWEEDQRRGGAYEEGSEYGASTDGASDSESDASYNAEYASSAGRNSDQESVAQYDAHDEPETDAQHYEEAPSDSDSDAGDAYPGEPHEYSAGDEPGYTSSGTDSAASDGAVSADCSSDDGDGYASAGSYVSDDGDDDGVDYDDYDDYDDDYDDDDDDD